MMLAMAHMHILLQGQYTHATSVGAPCSQHLAATCYTESMYLCIAQMEAYKEHIPRWIRCMASPRDR